MKRISALILAVLATLTLSACSNNEPKDSGSKSDNSMSSTPTDNSSSDTSTDNSSSNTSTDNSSSDTSTDNSSSTSEPTDNKPSGSAYADAVAVLEAAWAAYPEDDKFPIFGGSTDVAVDYDGKPGPFTISLKGEMGSFLHVPESIMPQIKSAASMINMMNANTFTCGAFEVDGDINAFSKALVDSVNSTQWMCGFPETVITIKVGNYLIMAFGHGEPIEKFKTAATTAVTGAALVHEGPVSFGGGGIALPPL